MNMKYGGLGFIPLFIVAALTSSAVAEPWLLVNTDETQLIRLAAPAQDVIISNPSIADVTVMASNLLAITGKTYGKANLIVRDKDGSVISDVMLQVVSPRGAVVVNHGSSRRTLSCTPRCQPALDIRDAPEHFDAIAKQAQVKLSQKVVGDDDQGVAPPGEYPCDSPRQLDSAGNPCGERSAYDRPGGRKGFK